MNKIFKTAPKPIIRKTFLNLENKYKDYTNDSFPNNNLFYFLAGLIFGLNLKKC